MNSLKNTIFISTTALTAAGVAFSFANASFIAVIPVESIMSICVSLGLLGIAAADYGRTNRSLVPLAALLRPVWYVTPTCPTRASAGNTNSPDRLAA